MFIFGVHQSLIIFFKCNGSSNKSITKQNKKLKVSSHLNYVNNIIVTLITIVHGQLQHNFYFFWSKFSEINKILCQKF
jgi:hypothetical protein